ncbi:NACHT-domain-containing protein [Diaporthe amygdali]|uniref:NACHT-domain-containing protein n=1 Tax=Phomopsis amygdali TaxID=1214568 RepID=UPI0022FE2611|nr:NACHT-domain-containing protein [Diaporthe amygdali]KAJ0103744.1 NACHT-domain-containing protein [Diaporthe amygdali]
MLHDPKLQGVYLVVDALDECEEGLPQLLELIIETSQSVPVKWLVSSRISSQIREETYYVAQELALEVNAKSVAAAVDRCIMHKVSQLVQRKGYRDNIAEEVRQHLLSNAESTFLWVASVCQKLEEGRHGNVLQKLNSFLTVREETIYFVYQSAKDFLMKEASDIGFPEQQAVVHGQIFSKSVEAMFQTLKRDIYGLDSLGFAIEDVPRQRPNPDPLATIAYSCVYWVDHLIDASKALDTAGSVPNDEAVARFLQSQGLYWIESLSLLRSMSEGMLAMEKLLRLFVHERPQWFECRTELAEQWGACEVTLESHTDTVWSAAFSPNEQYIVSASNDKTVKLEKNARLDDKDQARRQVAFGPDYPMPSTASDVGEGESGDGNSFVPESQGAESLAKHVARELRVKQQLARVRDQRTTKQFPGASCLLTNVFPISRGPETAP